MCVYMNSSYWDGCWFRFRLNCFYVVCIFFLTRACLFVLGLVFMLGPLLLAASGAYSILVDWCRSVWVSSNFFQIATLPSFCPILTKLGTHMIYVQQIVEPDFQRKSFGDLKKITFGIQQRQQASGVFCVHVLLFCLCVFCWLLRVWLSLPVQLTRLWNVSSGMLNATLPLNHLLIYLVLQLSVRSTYC